jgi:uncharacterized protein YcfL
MQVLFSSSSPLIALQCSEAATIRQPLLCAATKPTVASKSSGEIVVWRLYWYD